MSIDRLYLAGAGGHARELAWIARELIPRVEVIFVVDDERYLRPQIGDVRVIHIDAVEPHERHGFVAATGDGKLRRSFASRLAAKGVNAVKLVHPSVGLLPTSVALEGAVIASGCTVTDNVRIGRHAHINIGCTISHDVMIGDFVTLSPGVHVAGNVVIENGAFLGVGASVVNGTSDEPLVIGSDAVVGAGACVTRAVAACEVVVGVPARPLSKTRQ